MADIFISYARADAARVERLVRVLETRWSVFWDRTIPPGQTWDDYIGGQLESSRCVIVIWSSTSVASEWVREEAHHGRDRGALVPVLFDKVSPPFGFRQVQAADLTNWDGLPGDHAIDILMKTLEGLLPAAAPEPSSRRSHEPTSSAGDAPVSGRSDHVAPRSANDEKISRGAPAIAEGPTTPAVPGDAGTVPHEPRFPERVASRGRLPSFLRSRAGLAVLATCVVAAVLIGVWAWSSSPVLVRVRTGDGYTDLVHAGRVVAISFSADGRTLAASADGDGVRLWHLDDLSRAATVIQEYYAYDVAFHPSQPVLAIVQGDVTLRRIDDLQGGPSTLPGSAGANEKVAFSADGQLIAATGTSVTGLWRYVDERTAEVIRVREDSGSRFAMALSPDGAWLAADSAGNRGILDVWRANEVDAEPIIVGGSASTAWGVAFSQDSRLLAAATENGLHLWDTQNLQAPPQTLATTEIWSVAFSPDGQFLAAGDVAGAVTLWRLGETQPTSKLYLGSRVDRLAFSPDGRTLAAGSFEGIVRLWPVPRPAEALPRPKE